MRLGTLSLFAVAGGLALATACTAPDKTDVTDTDTDTDTDSDTDTDTDTDSDTDTDTNTTDSGTGYGDTYYYSGDSGGGCDTATDTACAVAVLSISATVKSGTSLAGTETYDIVGVPSGDVYCEYTWNMTATGKDARSDCTDCDFAFDITYSDGATTVGSCPAATDYNNSYGFASTWTYGSYSLNDVAMYYDSGYSLWWPFAYATYSGGDFEIYAYSSAFAY